ncbi:hypothetical protein JANAI62_07930 [Jannaschia pagri]|uniref:DUF465 domain-containing protein n=1 Tax=Jannaschia pagri TaxID=2829797 RepID=A0ABQ4NIW7_9RHOB|nr:MULTISPECIES: DUF465 domain-containing protein [unclassified Jannaschia]GIT89722.1 hypothetical protein JANAI61_01800 [Jannaschia sp. AI_61]GIT94170.1 hypothetical protein JANAI62_07930 [Jannaschia sp. AI_62]
MSHVPHDLSEEFPNDLARLAQLKAESGHVAKLADAYHRINREIHRAETNVEPCSDTHALELRRERLHLKDQIAGCLAAAR